MNNDKQHHHHEMSLRNCSTQRSNTTDMTANNTPHRTTGHEGVISKRTTRKRKATTTAAATTTTTTTTEPVVVVVAPHKKQKSDKSRTKTKGPRRRKTPSKVKFSPKKYNQVFLADTYDRTPPELDVYDCDGCGIKILQERHHCQECDYDLCGECFSIVTHTPPKSSTITTPQRSTLLHHSHNKWEFIPPDPDPDPNED